VLRSSLDDSGLAATPRRRPPIIVQHPSDVTRYHDNSSPSSTSSSSHESGIKSTTDSSSPEHHHHHHEEHHHWREQQQEHTQAAIAVPLNMPDDVPLDLSVTSSLPRQRINNDEAKIDVRHCALMSHHHDNDSRLSTPSFVEQLSLLSNDNVSVTPRSVTRRHDSSIPLSAFSFVDEKSPMLSNTHSLLHPLPPVFPQSHRCMTAPVIQPPQDTASDTSIRLPEPAKLLLTSWYETHIRHPYPQPDELSHLMMTTGQSRRKILKWLANRRARTGNTLPHNGSVHPRKIVKIRQLRQQAAEAEPHHRHQTMRRSRQRSSRFLPESVVDGLQRWYDDHLGYPYPTEADKRLLAEQLETTVVKVTNWFANKRNRSGHAKGGNVRQYDTASFVDSGQPLAASQLNWRFSFMRFPQSISASTLVQTRHWNDHGHLP